MSGPAHAFDALRRQASRVVLAALAVFAVAVVLERVPATQGSPAVRVLFLLGLVLTAAGLVATFAPQGASSEEPRVIRPPVAGRWVALNSPASRVPSHGTHAYGQSHAIDILHDPAGVERIAFGRGWGLRPAADFPSFGQELLSPVDGTVVAVRDSARDHRARNAWPVLPFFFVEGAVRELFGAGQILGNHVIIDCHDGSFAALAHLQRRSAQVRVGDRVVAGQTVGRCGNSGNTTEPHLHVQLMDRARPAGARGLPMVWADVSIEDGPREDALPANGEHVTA